MPRQRSQAEACAVVPVDPEVALLGETQAYFELRASGLACAAPLAAAWNQFYALYDPVIRRCIRRWHLPQPDSDDCAQEVWLEIVRQLGHFRTGAEHIHLRNWIATLAWNIAADAVRERTRHLRITLSAEVIAKLTGHEPDPADEYERHRKQTLVQEALDELAHRVSASSYRVLYLRSIEERTVTEVASELGLAPEQVRKRHHRMMMKLRRLIEILDGKTCSGGSPDSPPPPTMRAWIIEIRAGRTCPGGRAARDNRPKKDRRAVDFVERLSGLRDYYC